MLTSHMQNVLPVFINEKHLAVDPRRSGSRHHRLATAAEIGEETLKLGNEAETKLIDELKKEGHDVRHRRPTASRSRISARPSPLRSAPISRAGVPYIERIGAVK